jgi:hypothetical protein
MRRNLDLSKGEVFYDNMGFDTQREDEANGGARLEMVISENRWLA